MTERQGTITRVQRRGGASMGVLSSVVLAALILLFFGLNWWFHIRLEPPFDTLEAFAIGAVAIVYLHYQIRALQDRSAAADRTATRDMNFSYLPALCLIVAVILRVVDYFAIARVPAPAIVAVVDWLQWLVGFLSGVEWGAVVLVGGAIIIDVTQLADLSNRLMQRPTGPSISVTDVDAR